MPRYRSLTKRAHHLGSVLALGLPGHDNIICIIPLSRIRINRELKRVSEQCEIVITTNFDGNLKFHRREAIREQIVEHMDQWTTNRNTKDCQQSPKGQCEIWKVI